MNRRAKCLCLIAALLFVLAAVTAPTPQRAAQMTTSPAGGLKSTELVLQIVKGQPIHFLRNHTSPHFIPPRSPSPHLIPSQLPPPPALHSSTISEAAWLASAPARCIKKAESGGDYNASGYEFRGGAWQFNVGTWQGVGMIGYPNQASPATQDLGAYRLYLKDGYSQWETAAGCGV